MSGQTTSNLWKRAVIGSHTSNPIMGEYSFFNKYCNYSIFIQTLPEGETAFKNMHFEKYCGSK